MGQTRDSLAADASTHANGVEDRLALALAAAGMVGIWDADLVASRVYGDENFARIYGIDPAVAAGGRPLGTYVLDIHPDDVKSVRAAMEALYTGAPQFVSEHRIIRPDGAQRWVFTRGRLTHDASGLPIRFAGLSVDITDRKHTEMRQRFLLLLADRLLALGDPEAIARTAVTMLGEQLGASRVGYGQVHPDGNAISLQTVYSQGVEPIAGVLPLASFGAANVALQRQGRIMVHNDVAADPAGEAPIWAALGMRAVVAVPLIRDGVYSAALFANHHEPRIWTDAEIGLMQDVAARIWDALGRARAEDALRATNAMLEQRIEAALAERAAVEDALRQSQKMEAVGQLTGGLAHDFNNLLAGIIGSLELMQVRLEQQRFGDLGRYIQGARGAADRAAALTHRLLAFSRRQTLAPVLVNIPALVDGMQELIARTMGPGISVEMMLAPDLWGAVVDANQLENALLNLCLNARDAMPGGGQLKIEARNRTFDRAEAVSRDMAPGDYVKICVSDTGTGMPPEIISRAFDPFFTTKPLGTGTGLGLSMVYGFVRQSGGQVRIQSVLGGGTSVCIDLPRSDAVAPPAGRPIRPAETQAAGSGTVLIVDDEPTLRDLVAESLTDRGYAVLSAGDGPAAMRILESVAQIDLLVTDVGLPGGMNGRQLAEAARVARPALRVLFITGYAESTVLSHGDLPAGMAVLTKPFAMDALQSAIRASMT